MDKFALTFSNHTLYIRSNRFLKTTNMRARNVGGVPLDAPYFQGKQFGLARYGHQLHLPTTRYQKGSPVGVSKGELLKGNNSFPSKSS